MNYKAQGAIEYLLIIAAAILVVAIVIIAVTGALGGGQNQTTTSQEAYIAGMDELQKEYLIASDKLVIGGTASLSGQLEGPITRADGSPIASQADLDEAYANGELVLYYNGNPPSIIQDSDSSRETLTLTGCYGGTASMYGGDMQVYTGGSAQSTYYNKYGKIASVNANPTYSNYLNTIHSLKSSKVPSEDHCCAACGTRYCLYPNPATFSINSSSCPYSWASPGTTTAGWQIEIYDYNLVYGNTPGQSQIGIDPATGQITGITTSRTVARDCVDKGKYCYLPTADQSTKDACPSNTTCVGACTTAETFPTGTSCDLTKCKINLDSKPSGLLFCTPIYDTIPTITADYFH